MSPRPRRYSGSARTPLLCLIAAVGAAGAVFFYAQKDKAALQAQLAALREQARQAEAKAADPKEIERLRAQVREAATLKKEIEEIHRLRGEVTLLRKDKAIFEQAKAENAQLRDWANRVRAENAAVRGQPSTVQSQGQPMSDETRLERVEEARKIVCIENLKQIDGAVLQWALENSKTDASPVDIRRAIDYLRGSVLPQCPARGVYTPGETVSASPSCTVPGHTL